MNQVLVLDDVLNYHQHEEGQEEIRGVQDHHKARVELNSHQQARCVPEVGEDVGVSDDDVGVRVERLRIRKSEGVER